MEITFRKRRWVCEHGHTFEATLPFTVKTLGAVPEAETVPLCTTCFVRWVEANVSPAHEVEEAGE